MQRLARISSLNIPPLLELDTNPLLRAVDSVLGSGVPVNLPLSPHPILLTNIRG